MKHTFSILTLLVALMLALSARHCRAQEPNVTRARVFGVAIGANGIFNDQPSSISSDVEGAVNARASLSPHISLVGSGAYGFQYRYVRYTAGFRITVTDVEDPGLSVGVGLQYRGTNEDRLKPDEWSPDASVGWRPWRASMPAVVLVGQGWYGIDSGTGGALLGVRYVLPL